MRTNTCGWQKVDVVINNNMATFKVTDLRRLNKKDLINICTKNNLEFDNKNKEELVQLIVCQSSTASPGVESVGVVPVLPVPLDSTDITYECLQDHRLYAIPNFTFSQLYAYSCRGDLQSVKSLDRAVKHVEAGDIADLGMCQVSCVQLFRLF